jgi:hypothetical protein
MPRQLKRVLLPNDLPEMILPDDCCQVVSVKEISYDNTYQFGMRRDSHLEVLYVTYG